MKWNEPLLWGKDIIIWYKKYHSDTHYGSGSVFVWNAVFFERKIINISDWNFTSLGIEMCSFWANAHSSENTSF